MNRVQLRKITSVVLLLSAALLSSCSKLRETSALDRLKPCSASEGPGDAYCGTLDVWEDRHAQAGRKIALKIVVLPALKQDFAADPLFVLAGGPGQGAAALAAEMQELLRPIQRGRDIVLVDQRGTGKSNPLECEAADEDRNLGNYPAIFVTRMRACLDKYKNTADVTKYTTDIAVDDLDDVRAFLGYPKIDLYGVSYGTRAAIMYTRRHPDHTHAVILDSVMSADMRLMLYGARDGQRAIDRLVQDCERDVGCRQRFPNLARRLDALLTRLAAHAQHVRFTDPRTGLEKETDVTRFAVSSILLSTLYSPTEASAVPLLIEEAERGNFAGFFALAATNERVSHTVARGMMVSVICSEDAPRIETGAIEHESAGTFLGPDFAQVQLKPCEFWPTVTLDPSYYKNQPSDIPALILSGELDPVTPPSWGNKIAAQWKNSRQVVIPATGHDTAPSGCVVNLMAQFLDRGSASQLDTSCVDRLKRPPFLLGPSGPSASSGVRQ